MEYAYNYQARTSKGKLISGMVFAKNRPLGFSKLKRNGFAPVSVELNLPATVKGFISQEFNQVELARFYRTVGRRMNNGKSFVDGLSSAAEYVADPRLRQAILVMRQSTLDGQNEYTAMLNAGFPSRDAMVIRSTSSAGKTAETFIALSTEISRVHELRKSVRAIFRMPAILMAMMYAIFYGAIGWVAPMTMKFLANIQLKGHMSPFNQAYFDFAKMFNENFVTASAIYGCAPFALIFVLRSEAFKRMLDNIKRLRDISVKSDQAALWNSFAMLYDAAIPAKEICRILGDAAKRTDTKISFRKLGKLIESGRSIDDSVQYSSFPPFVVAGVRSSESGGDLVEGLRDMVRNLEEDVFAMTEVLQENVKLFALFIVAGGVGLIFFVTYYPILSSVLSAL